MTPNTSRTALLRDALEATVDALHRRRASEIPEDYIEDFVMLDWLEWNGGGLRLTVTGENVCRQLRARTSADGAIAHAMPGA